jgi:hypothetical protein
MFTTRPYNTESAADAFAESIKGCYKYIWKGCFSGKWFIRYGNKAD